MAQIEYKDTRIGICDAELSRCFVTVVFRQNRELVPIVVLAHRKLTEVPAPRQ